MCVLISRIVLDTVDIIVGCTRNCEAPTDKLTKQMILNICNKYHSLNCHHIMFIDSNSLTPYLQKNGQIARFSLYDDIRLKKLSTHILFLCNVLQENVVADNISVDGLIERCQSCFDVSLPKPLSVTNFDILREFHLDVPLEMQLILEMFINKNTLYHKNLSENFLNRKYERLYSVYEILLNTFNKKFIEILQQRIADKLLMNYHSISMLFKITSKYGFTASLTFAENNLISKSTDDPLYYQTYIKEYPITYDTLVGNVTQMVSLRQCHLILMLDNLVCLKYHSDPDPEEHRSKQLCMLPITLQGLPKDSKATENWHDVNICDGSQHC
ncbi:uncharacterized protein LOC126816909 [Patella vulgata]|uniref:uncharacterized protein LOC126816909 n=1 Tax=Patella vulgata TaxID=6465 RepID=UPI00217FB856|nr:uncharacterized protein LOC126816909 [Patella vulgata]